MTLSKAKINNGAQLFIPNKNAKFQDLPVKPKAEEEEEKIDTSKQSKAKSGKEDVEMTTDEPKKSECRHGPKGKCLNCLGVTKENFQEVDYKCTHPKGEMCANCKDTTKIQDAKHEPFDQLLKEMRARCKGKHKPDQRCQNCIPLESISYKMRRD